MNLRRALLALSFPCLVSGCSLAPGEGLRSLPTAADGSSANLLVAQKGKGSQWVSFTPKTHSTAYSAIVTGADKNVWFVDYDAAQLARMSMSGAVKEFTVPGLVASGTALI